MPSGNAECRYNYPCPTQVESTLKLTDGTIRATLTTRCNDPRVNSHSRLLLQHWQANVDIQMIVDVEACACYKAKYAAKVNQDLLQYQVMYCKVMVILAVCSQLYNVP